MEREKSRKGIGMLVEKFSAARAHEFSERRRYIGIGYRNANDEQLSYQDKIIKLGLVGGHGMASAYLCDCCGIRG